MSDICDSGRCAHTDGHGYQPDLETVLDEFAGEANPAQWETLAAWCERYPQYQRELTEFAVGWARIEFAATNGKPAPSLEVRQ